MSDNELREARETIRRLNRRCQEADAALAEKLDAAKRSGGSLGRSLLRWGYSKLERDLVTLREVVEKALPLIRQGCDLTAAEILDAGLAASDPQRAVDVVAAPTQDRP